MSFWLLFFGVLAGVTTVLFGFGGGFVMVPVLYALLLAQHGADSTVGQGAMHIAVATSTAVMVYGAGLATWRHHQRGHLRWTGLRLLLVFIGLGALLGAALAQAVSGAWVRWAFIVYLALTIADTLLRPGFVAQKPGSQRPLSKTLAAGAGVLIGAIAAFLGVGGSVMTVPLMRRRGASMRTATAMASPLSLPMAVVGSATYMLLASHAKPERLSHLSGWHIGYVDVQAALLLMLGSWLGIQLATPWMGRIPDAVHARAYVGLLCLVLALLLVL